MIRGSEELVVGEALQASCRSRRRIVSVSVSVSALLAGCSLLPRWRSTTASPQQIEVVRLVESLQEDAGKCSGTGPDGPDNCLETKCCSHPGFQCYEKHEYFAMCMATCSPGRNPTDPKMDTWTCKKHGKRSPGKRPTCSDVWSNCVESKCCQDPGATCFRKNDTWGLCKVTCQPGEDPHDVDGGEWSCQELGPTAPERAPWVESSCSRQGEDCSYSRCCLGSGMKCFEKNQYWATCRDKCEPGMIDKTEPEKYRTNWTCKTLGGPMVSTIEETKRKIALTSPLTVLKCAGHGEDCQDSRCCANKEHKCLLKNDTHAACLPESECAASESWSCDPLPRLSSLFCFAVFRVKTYEMGLIETQLNKGIGIFACDDTMLLADAKMSLGKFTRIDGQVVEVKTHTFKKEPVGLSQDGSAANTALFMKVWDVVLEEPNWRQHAWTLKVDPDAVLLPDRARQHVLKYVGKTVYVVNCNKYPDSNNFPMMYGPVEVFSKKAIEQYKELGWHCATELDWPLWGEDYYLTHCMDHIKVARVNDFEFTADGSCTGAKCSNGMSAAYHPFKDVKSWMDCLNEALQTKHNITYKYVDSLKASEAEEKDSDLEEAEIDPGPGWCCSYSSDEDDVCGSCQGKFAEDNYCGASEEQCQACQKTWCHDSDTTASTSSNASTIAAETAQASTTDTSAVDSEAETEETSASPSDWQCEFYDWKKGENCPENGERNDGFEYHFFGEDTPCPPCWCCKRTWWQQEDTSAAAIKEVAAATTATTTLEASTAAPTEPTTSSSPPSTTSKVPETTTSSPWTSSPSLSKTTTSSALRTTTSPRPETETSSTAAKPASGKPAPQNSDNVQWQAVSDDMIVARSLGKNERDQSDEPKFLKARSE